MLKMIGFTLVAAYGLALGAQILKNRADRQAGVGHSSWMTDAAGPWPASVWDGIPPAA